MSTECKRNDPVLFPSCFVHDQSCSVHVPFHVPFKFPSSPAVLHSCSLYVPFTSLQIPLLFPSCSPHAPQCSTMSPTCLCHIPAMSRHVPAMSPNVFGDTVTGFQPKAMNSLTGYKRRAAYILIYTHILIVCLRMNCSRTFSSAFSSALKKTTYEFKT